MIKISMHPRVFYFARQEYLDKALAQANRTTSENFKAMYLSQFSHVVVNTQTNCVEKCRINLQELVDTALGNPQTVALSEYTSEPTKETA